MSALFSHADHLQSPAASAAALAASDDAEDDDSSSTSSNEQPAPHPQSVSVTDPTCPRILYWGSGSPPAWRARLCLEEKKVPYRSMCLSFAKQEHKTAQILSLNPRGMVPILVDGGTVLYESLGIIQYIDSEVESVVTLKPTNKRLRARALVRMNEANNVSAVVGEVVYYLRRTAPSDINEDYLEVKKEAMYKEIALWEGYLDAGDFLAGDEVSIADISFFPTLAYTVRLGLSVSRFPRLNGYYQRMLQRPAVQASWPPHWLHSEGEQPLKGL